MTAEERGYQREEGFCKEVLILPRFSIAAQAIQLLCLLLHLVVTQGLLVDLALVCL